MIVSEAELEALLKREGQKEASKVIGSFLESFIRIWIGKLSEEFFKKDVALEKLHDIRNLLEQWNTDKISAYDCLFGIQEIIYGKS